MTTKCQICYPYCSGDPTIFSVVKLRKKMKVLGYEHVFLNKRRYNLSHSEAFTIVDRLDDRGLEGFLVEKGSSVVVEGDRVTGIGASLQLAAVLSAYANERSAKCQEELPLVSFSASISYGRVPYENSEVTEFTSENLEETHFLVQKYIASEKCGACALVLHENHAKILSRQLKDIQLGNHIDCGQGISYEASIFPDKLIGRDLKPHTSEELKKILASRKKHLYPKIISLKPFRLYELAKHIGSRPYYYKPKKNKWLVRLLLLLALLLGILVAGVPLYSYIKKLNNREYKAFMNIFDDVLISSYSGSEYSKIQAAIILAEYTKNEGFKKLFQKLNYIKKQKNIDTETFEKEIKNIQKEGLSPPWLEGLFDGLVGLEILKKAYITEDEAMALTSLTHLEKSFDVLHNYGFHSSSIANACGLSCLVVAKKSENIDYYIKSFYYYVHAMNVYDYSVIRENERLGKMRIYINYVDFLMNFYCFIEQNNITESRYLKIFDNEIFPKSNLSCSQKLLTSAKKYLEISLRSERVEAMYNAFILKILIDISGEKSLSISDKETLSFLKKAHQKNSKLFIEVKKFMLGNKLIKNFLLKNYASYRKFFNHIEEDIKFHENSK